jgi:site-specific DNA-cytosine methylase
VSEIPSKLISSFRLMGFLNDEINLDGISDTQKYKLAGNGWDINLVSKLFKEMLKVEEMS